MPFTPSDFALVQRTAPDSVSYTPNDGTYNDNYDPKVAQQGESPFGVELIVGTPESDCYGLYTEPFNECANFLSILEKDNKIVAFYNLIVTNLTGENLSLPFVEGVTRSIFNEASTLKPVGYNFINSIIGHVSPNPFWTDNNGNTIGISEDAYWDPTIDRTGWTYSGDPPSSIDSLILDTYKETLDLLEISVGPYRIFDITGNIYAEECTGRPFSISVGSLSANIGWVQAVAEWGPDAVRRGDYKGDYFQGQPSQVEQEATFYNMCRTQKGCIKEYRLNYPAQYEADVAALTDEQLASLQGFPDIQSSDSVGAQQILKTALDRINVCYSFITDPNYYNQSATRTVTIPETNVPSTFSYGLSAATNLQVRPERTYTFNDNGRLNDEVLYRVAISAAAIRNIITLLLESIVGVTTATTVSEYNDYVDQIEQDLQDEYDRRQAEEEERRIARAEAQAERFFVCRTTEPSRVDVCLDKPNPTKTFLDNWTIRDRTTPYYSPDKKKYYIVYDVVTNDFRDFQTKIDSYKLQAFDILDNTFKFNLFNNAIVSQQTRSEKANSIVKLEEDGIYFEPRAYKPSKILFSVSEQDLSLEPKNIEVVPRFTDQPPSSDYIRSYSMTIRDFFASLESLENILKKYVFDHALWKVTFGNENPSVTNLAISASKIFNNLKYDILKQDSRNFQKFRPLFTKLLSKNGISLADDIRLSKPGQYLLDDRIMLVFSFENPDNVTPPATVEGTSVVAPQNTKEVAKNPINTLTKPPTNNSGSGLANGLVAGKNIRIYKVQVMNGSRPATDLMWKNADGSGTNLEGLNSEEVFRQEAVMNYLMNLDTLLALLRPDKNDRS